MLFQKTLTDIIRDQDQLLLTWGRLEGLGLSFCAVSLHVVTNSYLLLLAPIFTTPEQGALLRRTLALQLFYKIRELPVTYLLPNLNQRLLLGRKNDLDAGKGKCSHAHL